MTRIEWLLKGDSFFSLNSTRRISFRIPRQSETTKERSGPGQVPAKGFRGLVEYIPLYPIYDNTKGTPQGPNDFMR